jgi:hypothetical protein
MQYNLYVKSVNETEEQQRAAMDNTCNSLVNLLETDKAERRVDDGNNGNKGGYKRYEKKNNFNPTMRHNAFLDRRVEFEDNEEVDEDNAGGDEDYYGGNYSGNSGMQSPYSSRSVNSSYEGSQDQYKIWSASEMEQWQEHAHGEVHK